MGYQHSERFSGTRRSFESVRQTNGQDGYRGDGSRNRLQDRLGHEEELREIRLGWNRLRTLASVGCQDPATYPSQSR